MNADFLTIYSPFLSQNRSAFDPVSADTALYYRELDESAATEALEESIKTRLAEKFNQNLYDASGWLDDAEQRLVAIQKAAFRNDAVLCAVLVREMFCDFKEAWIEKEAAEIMKPGAKQDAFNYGLF